MNQSASIQVGGQVIGTVALDVNQVRGEGGPYDARGCLLLTATLLDHLRSLFSPPPIGLNQSAPRR